MPEPPVAASACEYATPAVPAGSVVPVVMLSVWVQLTATLVMLLVPTVPLASFVTAQVPPTGCPVTVMLYAVPVARLVGKVKDVFG